MDAIQESFVQMKLMFAQRMEAFEKQQTTRPSTTDVTSLATEFASFKDFMIISLKSLQSQIEALARQLDQQEMRGRRKFLLLHGISEEQAEDTSAIVAKTLAHHLNLTHFASKDIRQCFRLGRSKTANKARPILVQLYDESVRNKIWSSKSSFKGSGITVSEFLTKTRHNVLLAARTQFGVTRCWTNNGFVYVIGMDGSRHRVSTTEDLSRIAALHPTKSPVGKPQKTSTEATGGITVEPKAKRAAKIRK